MNVGSLMSSLTTSLSIAPAAPFASAAMVSGSCDVFTVAMVFLRFRSSSPHLRTAGPSGGAALRDGRRGVRSCLAPGTGALRSPGAGPVDVRCAHSGHAVVIPDGEPVTSGHLDRIWRLLFERGEGPLQEVERAAELG